MQYFFNLFNSEKVENFIYEENKNIKTNLNFFNVKFYLEDLTDLEISDCELIIEKENEGKYNFNNKISGEIEEGLVEFKNAEFKNAIEELSNYRIYFELKQGGITVLSTKKDSINFTLYMKAIDFDINFKDAIKLNDIYELQKENLEELIFEFSVNNFNNFQYYYEINSKEEIVPRDYKILSNNNLLINESLNIEHFKDGFTYLHFFLKDSFENVKYKKYKITTKNNTFTLLNILNEEITLSKLDEEFSIFYESRNITQLKPIIQYKVNGESFQKEGTNIGTFSQDKKMFLLNLKEQFSNIESNEMFLFFILNNNEKLISNEVFISIDNEEPEVEIQEYYLIKNKEVNELTISGKIIDKNLFFLGNSVKTIKPKTKLLFINSELNLLKVVFSNGEEQYLEKFSNYYTCETKNLTFEVFDVDNNQVNKNNIKYLNTTDENKHFYIWLDKNKLSLFEQNLLNTQNSIKIKGNEIEALIISQEQLVFDNVILLKVTLSPTATGTLEFDLGVDGLEYSFLYHLNNSNISLEMNNKKQLILDFKNTELIISKSEKTNILKYNNSKILSKKDIIPGEHIEMGSQIKVYVTKVDTTGKNVTVLLSRRHYGFVKRLFESEIPEITSGTVLIYSVARDAGSRSKVAVASDNMNIDPLGACIGEKGSRINRIIKELNGEKLDIIKYDSDPAKFIENALLPAKNLTVAITDEKKQEALVIADGDNFSLAIGKKGQNAKLASRLTHYKIDIKTKEEAAEAGINIR